MVYKILHIPTAKYAVGYSLESNSHIPIKFILRSSANWHITHCIAFREYQDGISMLLYYDTSDDYSDINVRHFEVIEDSE